MWVETFFATSTSLVVTGKDLSRWYNVRLYPLTGHPRRDQMTPSPREVTQVLVDSRNGNKGALDRLTPLVSSKLRWLAKRYMCRENPGHTRQTTALVNEACLRLTNQH